MREGHTLAIVNRRCAIYSILASSWVSGSTKIFYREIGMVTNVELNVKFEIYEATTNTWLEAMQNTVKTILEELRHFCIAQVHPPIQNVQVKQTVDRRHIEDNAWDLIKSVKVEASHFDAKETSVSSLVDGRVLQLVWYIICTKSSICEDEVGWT